MQRYDLHSEFAGIQSLVVVQAELIPLMVKVLIKVLNIGHRRKHIIIWK